MAEPVVDLRGVEKTYYGVEPEPVLRGIDLQVPAGQFLAVLGQSGSGKSTLLNLIGALDHPTGGMVCVAGHRLDQMNDDELANLRNTTIGFIFQFHYLLDEFTCLENALMPIAIRKGEPDDADVAHATELLDRVGLGNRLHRYPTQISGGEQQRTAIVRALVTNPRLVLADEPTGNLDSRNSRDVFALMREMNKATGVAFIMVTHEEYLAREADRIIRIVDGIVHEE